MNRETIFEEVIVTFETAKLLKEVKLPQLERMKAYDSEEWLNAHGDECDGEYYTAPTQANMGSVSEILEEHWLDES